jgi:hypothetical protein
LTDPTPPAEPQRSRAGPMAASGIIALRTGFIRTLRRAPKLPRPSWAVSVSLLLAAAVLAGAAGLHRRALDRRFAEVVRRNAGVPADIRRVQRELADSAADEKTLASELDARLQYARSLRSEAFFIVLDAASRRLRFHYGDRVVREAPAEPGPGRTIELGDRRWSFAPLSGAYSIREKLEDADWTPPPWVYAMNGMKPPSSPQPIEGGLGRYVIVLSEDAVIHSPPPPESPLKGVKPGSFLVPEADLAAIWKRVGPRTRVYVF